MKNELYLYNRIDNNKIYFGYWIRLHKEIIDTIDYSNSNYVTISQLIDNVLLQLKHINLRVFDLEIINGTPNRFSDCKNIQQERYEFIKRKLIQLDNEEIENTNKSEIKNKIYVFKYIDHGIERYAFNIMSENLEDTIVGTDMTCMLNLIQRLKNVMQRYNIFVESSLLLDEVPSCTSDELIANNITACKLTEDELNQLKTILHLNTDTTGLNKDLDSRDSKKITLKLIYLGNSPIITATKSILYKCSKCKSKIWINESDIAKVNFCLSCGSSVIIEK